MRVYFFKTFFEPADWIAVLVLYFCAFVRSLVHELQSGFQDYMKITAMRVVVSSERIVRSVDLRDDLYMFYLTHL